jgi:hypothetical protein
LIIVFDGDCVVALLFGGDGHLRPFFLLGWFGPVGPRLVLGRYSADETFDVGMDTGPPVSEPYTGTLRKVEFHLEPMDHTENDIKAIREAERAVE